MDDTLKEILRELGDKTPVIVIINNYVNGSPKTQTTTFEPSRPKPPIKEKLLGDPMDLYKAATTPIVPVATGLPWPVIPTDDGEFLVRRAKNLDAAKYSAVKKVAEELGSCWNTNSRGWFFPTGELALEFAIRAGNIDPFLEPCDRNPPPFCLKPPSKFGGYDSGYDDDIPF